MRVTRIEIVNFRGLSSKDEEGEEQPVKALPFDPTFNVLIGVNGIGKSSVLDALAILLSRVLPRTMPAKGTHRRFAPTDFRHGSTAITGRLWLDFDGMKVDYSLMESVDDDDLTEDIDRKRFKVLAERYDSEEPTAPTNAPIALLYTTDRAAFRFPRKIEAPPPGRAAAYQSALREKTINYAYAAQWLRAKRALAEESSSEAHLLATIEEALRRFLPAFGDLEAEEDPPRLFVRKKGVRLGIEQLSDGERSFLAMVVDIARHLAQANPAAVNPLSQGKGVVLIDELELHLHPKWQRTSVSHLQETFPGLQFIATTHSPFVVQSLRPGQLINLEPESYAEEYADKSIEDISEDVMGVEMPQKSQRYQEMMVAAEQYFRLLRTEQPSTPQEKETLKQALDELSIPFSDDPAYMALLKVEREMALGEGNDAPR